MKKKKNVQKRSWGLGCVLEPRRGRTVSVEQAAKKPELWRRLVQEQVRYLKRLIRAGKRQKSMLRFGDYQHPELSNMFGKSGKKEFHTARDQWLSDINAKLDE